METEHDDIVLALCRLTNENYIVNLKNGDGLEGDDYVKKTLPSHLGTFILSNSKRNRNIFVREINGFYNNCIYYSDTVTLYKEKK